MAPRGTWPAMRRTGVRAGVCVGQAGRGVVEAHARHHQRHPRFSRRAGVAVGHVRGRLLVAGRDHAYARLVTQRGHDPVDLYARNPEHDLDAFSYERPGEGFSSAHFDHDSPASQWTFVGLFPAANSKRHGSEPAECDE